MPTNTYTPIASVTLSASASEVVFSGLPQTFRDLIVVAQVRSNRAATDDDLFAQFNSDTGANYSYVRMVGRSAGASSASNINGTNQNDLGQIPAASSTSGQLANTIFQVMDYAETNKHKTTLTRTNAAGSTDVTGAHAGRWANTSAISTIRIYPRLGSFIADSTFTVFGVIA
jgi:hypothetical protein